MVPMKTLLLSLLLSVPAYSLNSSYAYQILKSHLEGKSQYDSEASTRIVVGDKESFRFLKTSNPRCLVVLGWYRERLHVYEDREAQVSCRNFKASVCGSKISLYWTELADCE